MSVRATVPNSCAIFVRYCVTDAQSGRPVSDVNLADLHRIGSICHSCVAVVRAGNAVDVFDYRFVDLQRSNCASAVSNNEVVPARLDGDQCNQEVGVHWRFMRFAHRKHCFAYCRHSCRETPSGLGR